MNIPEFIRKKREGGSLAGEEIQAFITGYVQGTIPDYQVAAFLMAVFFRGMTPEEAAGLTRSMMHSGRTYDLSAIVGPKVDKHSTGGVGDKVSLILAPLAAAAGIRVPMVSGRGLGHTGGTLDKLDSIPGYRWALSEDEFKGQLARVGCAIIGQTSDFVPADKKIYALRDVTATVESIPLICASILSKKAASGTRALLMDVKAGSGAFMPTTVLSRELARQLVKIGKALGLPTVALLTRMDRPLGTTIGNALEVRESMELLQGRGPTDSRDLTIRQAAEMILLAGIDTDLDAATARATRLLDSGKAAEKAQEWIAAQGGDPRVVEDTSLLTIAKEHVAFTATRDGVVASCNTRLVGVAANTLGAGRMKADDVVDTTVGFTVERQPGDRVRAGDAILTVHHNKGRGLSDCMRLLDEAYRIADVADAPMPLVLERLT